MPRPELAAGVSRLLGLGHAAWSVQVARAASPLERARALQRASRSVLAAAGLTVEVAGPVPSGPAVLVANHVSWFDPLVVATALPLTAVAKDDVGAWPLVGERARGLGVVFVDRLVAHSGVRALLQARAALRGGVPVLNFPEGTTTHGDMVLPFRRGVFGLARLAGVPVVPVRLEVDRALTWAGPDPLLPHLWRLCATRGPRVRVQFLPPLEASGESDAARAEAARRLLARPSSLRPLPRPAVATRLAPRPAAARGAALAGR